MNSLLFAIILIPAVEIYLFIKIGAVIGAFKTVILIFFTAFIGIYYARAEGLNTLNNGLKKMFKNEMPAYELISGATLAFAAFLLILPGFATDLLGILLAIPLTRKILLGRFIKKKEKEKKNKKNYIEGEFEDISEDHDKKI